MCMVESPMTQGDVKRSSPHYRKITILKQVPVTPMMATARHAQALAGAHHARTHADISML